MSFLIQYRPLFEVRLLHDYYLNRASSFFHELDLTDDGEKEEIVERLSHYDISNDFLFKLPSKTKKFLNAHKMVFRTTETGFVVFIKVKQQINGNTIKYKPFIELEDAFELVIQMYITNPVLPNFTALPMKPVLDAHYHFTNKDQEDKIYPSLSLPAPSFESGKHYEMGCLVSVGGNLFEALKNTAQATSNISDWKPIDNDFRQVTVADQYVVYASYLPKFFPAEEKQQLVLTALFDYKFPRSSSVSTAEFVLTPIDVNVAPLSIQKSGENLKRVSLKFESLEEGNYLLTVDAGSYVATHYIRVKADLFDQRNKNQLFAVLAIGHEADLNDFRLFEDDGSLRMNATQTTTATPIFEVRLRNRATYWKYIPAKNETVLADSTQLKREEEAGSGRTVYVSKQPQAFLERSKINIVFDGNNANLPNPIPANIRESEDRFISEVYLPKLQES
ncbi:MAG: hypothetical protein AAF806_10150 [Bacteroidota bacterium]